MSKFTLTFAAFCFREWLPFLLKVTTPSGRRYLELVQQMDEWLKFPEPCWTELFLKQDVFTSEWLRNGCNLRQPNQCQWRGMWALQGKYLRLRTPGRHMYLAWDSDSALSCFCLSQNPRLPSCKPSEVFF